MRLFASALLIVVLSIGVMGCNKAELEAKDKEIAGLKEKVTVLETENADLKGKLAVIEEAKAAAAEAAAKKPARRKKAGKRAGTRSR